jgi:4-hydroxy-tetrahydrodipicolinate synthase
MMRGEMADKMNFKPFGIIPPIVTPLTEAKKVNEPALRQLVNFLIDGGVHGLFPVGTTGEFYSLSNEEFRMILEVTVDEARGRVPVYAGVNHITTRGIIELAEIAEAVGVDALSALTPMFLKPNQDQIYQHYKSLAASTGLPIILYNNKPKTGVDITPATVAKLAELDNIVGVKDSTGDLTMTEEYLRLTCGKDFAVMMGRDTLIYAALCYGASGAVASCANVAPELVVDIYNKYMAGDHEGAREAQFKVAPLRIAFNLGTFPAVIKAGLRILGIDVGDCFEPVGPLTDGETAQLRQIMTEMELL